MNLKLTITLVFIFLVNIISAQTKLIAHKSHSGSSENFRKSLENDLFDISNSNFGQAPQRVVRNANLDSLVFISETKAIMITSNHCLDTYTDSTSIWKAGKDTVYNHPLFSKKHALDSIKIILRTEYFFNNPIDDVIFIGYDNCTIKQEKQQRQD